MECSIDGCESEVFSRGWCVKHYTRWQRHGDPTITKRTPPMTATATEKLCPRCGNTKPIGEFGTRGRSSKPEGYCKVCKIAYDSSYAATPEGRAARIKARAKWNDNNHEYFLMYRYGLSKSEYERLLAAQGHACAICGATTPGGTAKVWCVDHCHNSNEVRGLLCNPCNRGLGQFKDDPDRLRSAIAYLDRSLR